MFKCLVECLLFLIFMKNRNEDCFLKILGDGFIREVLKSLCGCVNDFVNKFSIKRFYILVFKY